MRDHSAAEERARLRREIIARLDSLDEAQLRTLAAQLDLAPGPERPAGTITRRHFLAGLVGIGAVGAGAGTTAGLLRGASQAWAEANRRIEVWRGLVALYEEMSAVEVDAVVAQALEELSDLVTALRAQVPRVLDALDQAEAFLQELDQALAAVDQGLAVLERAVDSIANLLAALEDGLAEMGERAGPVGERLGRFFRSLLQYIPLGLGDRLLALVERLQNLLASLPDAVASINTDVIAPLRQRYFPREGETVRVRLADALVARLFAPLRTLLVQTEALLAKWEEVFAGPAAQRLAELEAAREAIAAYRRAHGLDSDEV